MTAQERQTTPHTYKYKYIHASTSMIYPFMILMAPRVSNDIILISCEKDTSSTGFQIYLLSMTHMRKSDFFMFKSTQQYQHTCCINKHSHILAASVCLVFIAQRPQGDWVTCDIVQMDSQQFVSALLHLLPLLFLFFFVPPYSLFTLYLARCWMVSGGAHMDKMCPYVYLKVQRN